MWNTTCGGAAAMSAAAGGAAKKFSSGLSSVLSGNSGGVPTCNWDPGSGSKATKTYKNPENL